MANDSGLVNVKVLHYLPEVKTFSLFYMKSFVTKITWLSFSNLSYKPISPDFKQTNYLIFILVANNDLILERCSKLNRGIDNGARCYREFYN